MTTLRSKIIHLAHAKPALRPVLLPLLKRADMDDDDDDPVLRKGPPEPGTPAHKLYKKLWAVFTKLDMQDRAKVGRDGDYRWRWDYSGRGMMGANSSVAVTIADGPGEKLGKALIKAGMSYDNMGMEWIYYTKW